MRVSPAKLGALAFVTIVLVTLAFRITAFVHIFFEHAGVALTQQEVADAHNAVEPDTRQAVVPRIIHQTFHNWTDPDDESLPSDWDETRQTCIDLNPDWEYRLWTAKSSRAFLEKEYPWFLETYDNFKLPIQRLDTLRYFLIRHYGGIYIDLDNGCLTSLEPLRYYPAWVTDGGHGALSNNILGAEPQHPYWVLMTNSIKSHAWNYPLPYITISYATGQWYETKIWEEYHRNRSPEEPELTRVMMDGRSGAAPWIFFTHTRGGTWDNWDNRMFGWIGEHVFLLVLMICGLVVSVVGIAYLIVLLVKRYWLDSRKGRPRKEGYQLINLPPSQTEAV